MRVGANARQYARIKRMHAENTPPGIIARTINMTPQSLEKILAHLDDRDEVVLAIEENPEVQAMRIENAELAARLAKYENPDDGNKEETETSDSSGDETQEESETQEA